MWQIYLDFGSKFGASFFTENVYRFPILFSLIDNDVGEAILSVISRGLGASG